MLRASSEYIAGWIAGCGWLLSKAAASAWIEQDTEQACKSSQGRQGMARVTARVREERRGEEGRSSTSCMPARNKVRSCNDAAAVTRVQDSSILSGRGSRSFHARIHFIVNKVKERMLFADIMIIDKVVLSS